MRNIFFLTAYCLSGAVLPAQNTVGERSENKASRTNYWQQEVNYTMDVKMNVKTYRYTGRQQLKYTNNSPDTLRTVFYHLYPNAFQPGSEMDVRSRTIADPDPRVADRISKLTPAEFGYLRVKNLRQNGAPVNSFMYETILKVPLQWPLLPGETTVFDLEFEGQVPLQIRRSGRNNKEGVALSMTQWYPKIAEYDFEGWHADPYVGREFHGVWGTFNVKITIDKRYILGGSGYLQNPQEVGYGYEDPAKPLKRPAGEELTWHFYAPDVHDFTWAGDPAYIHEKQQLENGPVLHFLYKKNDKIIENWKRLQPKAVEMMNFYSRMVGAYPYKQYSIIQGGDGGMEYPMCTLITGERSFNSLAGVTAHEMAHAWFQLLLATNEAEHPWMDEGFASFISDWCMNQVMGEAKENPYSDAYRDYVSLALSGKEQPQTTHADRYVYNQAYGISAYSKGEVFLAQLGYIIGFENLKKTLKRFYTDFRFTHPTPTDFIRTAEKVSGLQLNWYLTDWTQTTNTIDYGIKEVTELKKGTKLVLERIGLMPMPLEVVVETVDGTKKLFYIPLRMLYGKKEENSSGLARTVTTDWAWAQPTYELMIEMSKSSIKSIVIDPSQLMADVNRGNNVYGVK